MRRKWTLADEVQNAIFSYYRQFKCVPTVKWIESVVSVSKRTICRVFDKLRKCGFLKTIKKSIDGVFVYINMLSVNIIDDIKEVIYRSNQMEEYMYYKSKNSRECSLEDLNNHWSEMESSMSHDDWGPKKGAPLFKDQHRSAAYGADKYGNYYDKSPRSCTDNIPLHITSCVQKLAILSGTTRHKTPPVLDLLDINVNNSNLSVGSIRKNENSENFLQKSPAENVCQDEIQEMKKSNLEQVPRGNGDFVEKTEENHMDIFRNREVKNSNFEQIPRELEILKNHEEKNHIEYEIKRKSSALHFLTEIYRRIKRDKSEELDKLKSQIKELNDRLKEITTCT